LQKGPACASLILYRCSSIFCSSSEWFRCHPEMVDHLATTCVRARNLKRLLPCSLAADGSSQIYRSLGGIDSDAGISEGRLCLDPRLNFALHRSSAGSLHVALRELCTLPAFIRFPGSAGRSCGR